MLTWRWRSRKTQRITEVITVHPEGNMNVWTTFHHNPYKGSDISLRTTNVNLLAVKSGSPKSAGFILWGPWMSEQNFMTIRPIAVEVFQSGTKWWATPLTWLKNAVVFVGVGALFQFSLRFEGLSDAKTLHNSLVLRGKILQLWKWSWWQLFYSPSHSYTRSHSS